MVDVWFVAFDRTGRLGLLVVSLQRPVQQTFQPFDIAGGGAAFVAQLANLLATHVAIEVAFAHAGEFHLATSCDFHSLENAFVRFLLVHVSNFLVQQGANRPLCGEPSSIPFSLTGARLRLNLPRRRTT